MRAANILTSLIANHGARWDAFSRAVDFVNCQRVPGEIVEFDVFGGASLALLAHAHARHPAPLPRQLVGFDSFSGLPKGAEPHEFCHEGAFRVNYWWHPTLPVGAPVTPQVTVDLFQRCGLPQPVIREGSFEQTIPCTVPVEVARTAIVHIDCDLYESAKAALDGIAPALQEGTVLLFDDWYLYGGNPARGEARALAEFLSANPRWGAQDYGSYAAFAKAFVMYEQ